MHGVSNATTGRISESAFNLFWHHWWWLFVKGWHVTEFAVLCLLLFLSMRKTSQWPFQKAMSMAVACSVLYASSDEYHQTFVRDRGGKVSDVLIDCIGVTAVMIGIFIVRTARIKRTEC